MRALLLAALSSTALIAAAHAQQQPSVTPSVVPQGTAQAKAAVGECDRLMNYLEVTRPANAGVTVEQASAWRQAANFEACRENLLRLSENKGDSFSTQSNQVPSSGDTSGPTGLPTVTSSGRPASPPDAQPAPPAQTQPQAAAPPSVPPQGYAAANPGQTAQPQPTPSATAPSGAAQGASPGPAAASQVVVQQAQPNVTVRQAQPEIIVRQAPPVITVQQAQPEIIVRMPPPDVSVAMVQPQVQVTIPQPQVQVVPPQTEVQPIIQTEGQQPNVRFERTGEPRIVYQPAEGQPQVRFETADQNPGASQNTGATQAPLGVQAQNAQASQTPPAVAPRDAQAQLNGGPVGIQGGYAAGSTPRPAEPAQTGALPGATQMMKVSDLEEMVVYSARGEKLGEVEGLLMGADNKPAFLVSHGGFLGLGAKRVAIPSDQVAMRGDRLTAENLTDDQIRALPEFKDSASYREMANDQTASVRVSR